MDPLLPLPARLLSRTDLTGDTTLFRFTPEAPGAPDGTNHHPGQFVMLSVAGVGEAPFSLCHAPRPGPLELCIRRVGSVTNRLFQLPPGSPVGIRGPYGRGFPWERIQHKDLILVAGGLGVAPLRGLLQWTLAHRREVGRVIMVYGMRRQREILFREELATLMANAGVEIYLAVEHPEPDDPFPAHVGPLSLPLERIPLEPARTVAACCGPPGMYGPVAALLKRRDLPPEQLFFSFERRMECGIGHCGHCAIAHRYTCVEGPVFSAWEARDLREVWEEPYARTA